MKIFALPLLVLVSLGPHLVKASCTLEYIASINNTNRVTRNERVAIGAGATLVSSGAVIGSIAVGVKISSVVGGILLGGIFIGIPVAMVATLPLIALPSILRHNSLWQATELFILNNSYGGDPLAVQQEILTLETQRQARLDAGDRAGAAILRQNLYWLKRIIRAYKKISRFHARLVEKSCLAAVTLDELLVMIDTGEMNQDFCQPRLDRQGNPKINNYRVFGIGQIKRYLKNKLEEIYCI